MATAPKKTPPTTPVEVSPVSAWKKPLEPTELPSGLFMKFRKIGFDAFMHMGIIPNSLMAEVQKAVSKGNAKALELFGDNADMSELMGMIDNAVVAVAVEPQVYAAPRGDEPRREDLLYVDEIDMADKNFIFQLCTGGTKDLASFRAEQADGMAALL